MIIRRCSQGHHVRVHKNTTPGTTRVKTYPDGTTETLAYPSAYSYFVDVDGEVKKKSNSFKVVEEFYVSECAKKHSDGHGRVIIGKHHLINGVATSQEDYPTNSNTKSQIQDFYDKRGISYGSSETKAELLSRIVPKLHVNKEVSKHLKV
jgi:hypothetical protein|tara:strand:- start:417 stop:866 length:450 start_codon:yes stop_codon:yes gene_type:complete